MSDKLNTKEAAGFCGVSLKTFYAWLSEGRAPAHYRVSPRRFYFTKDDLEKWMEARRVEAVR